MRFCYYVGIAILLLVSFSASLGERIDYSGHKVVRARAANVVQLSYLRHLQSSDDTLDFWTDPYRVGKPVDIHVTPGKYEGLARSLSSVGIQHHIKVDDIGKAEKEERQTIELRRELTKNQKAFDFENYHTYEEIVAYMEQLALENPLVSVSSIGTTFENRSLTMATISTGSNPDKQVIVFECAVHAREWAAPSTCIWFINELATKYGIDSEITQLVDGFDWKITPVTNPDGYTYSWTTDRLWRKNRKPSDTCYGVDINRNFDTNFGGLGASDIACIDTYHGPYSFSEEESSAVRDVLIANRPRVKAAISIHTYSQLWMSPYAYTHDLPLEYDEMLRVMSIGVQALQNTYGTQYQYGNHADTIYIASGTTVDHAYSAEGILYAYLLELRDTGEFGFQLPASQIMETAVETWNGIKAMALEIL
ncbi:hypothetical protein GHT06_013143 [Daphnia sinensis]|uniref:Zinc carboxypeptidase A 1 n=1 Tax=Daphnia sinensis TaxID=1820382 RepID=A0AAD5LH46_9CRUS|nr:hypothetical protein GHT06_013143 [Daphnia sinensis]